MAESSSAALAAAASTRPLSSSGPTASSACSSAVRDCSSAVRCCLRYPWDRRYYCPAGRSAAGPRHRPPHARPPRHHASILQALTAAAAAVTRRDAPFVLLLVRLRCAFWSLRSQALPAAARPDPSSTDGGAFGLSSIQTSLSPSGCSAVISLFPSGWTIVDVFFFFHPDVPPASVAFSRRTRGNDGWQRRQQVFRVILRRGVLLEGVGNGGDFRRGHYPIAVPWLGDVVWWGC